MLRSIRPRALCAFALLSLVALFVASASAQSDSSRSLPDAPAVAQAGQVANPVTGPAVPPPAPAGSLHDSLEGKQTKRILGIVPNFRAVSVDAKLPPENWKEKFRESSEDAFDYSDFVFVAILAGVGQAQNSYPEFHQGAVGYGRYYWHSLADQVDEDYQVEFLFPAALHQDSRYYTLGRGGFPRRLFYAFSRIAVTRTDGGGEAFNASEVVGAGAAAGISDLYYPSPERTWTKTGQRWLLNVGLDGATFAFKEFWPDLNSRFFHQKD
ncbi:MAG: hypothetical protein ACLGXA_08585 [Acidobacteriota bacterium]